MLRSKKLLIKGPKHVPILGWKYRGLQMLKDPAEFFMNLRKNFGDFCSWDPLYPKQFCAFGADLNRYIFSQPEIFIVDAFRESNLPKDSAIERLSFGLMRLNGDAHKKHRLLMQPAFRISAVNSYMSVILNEAKKIVNYWQPGEERMIDEDIMTIISNISLKTMFGIEDIDISTDLHEKMKTLLKIATNPLNLLLPFDLPGLPYRKMLRTADKAEEIVKKIIHQKKSNINDDILSILINSSTNEGEKLSENELISEAYTSLCHESAAAALTWTIFLLERHPTIFYELVDEINYIFQNEDPTGEKLEKTNLLDNIIKESVRLLPPAGFSLRYLNFDHEYKDILMEKGSMVFLSSYVTHRNPDIFENPLHFNPKRWETIKPSPYEYLPFGCGTHSCIGKYFAMLEMKIILVLFLQRFSFCIPPDFCIDRGMRVSMVPKHGLKIKLDLPNKKIAINRIKGNIHQSVMLAS